MATYKTANNLPIMEEVTESTYALVEENGTLKRVSGENLGGKSNYCVITIEQTAVMESGVENTDNGVTYTCNMTYDELVEAFNNKTLVGLNVNTYSDAILMTGYASGLSFGDGVILIAYYNDSGESALQFVSDNTISEYAPAS